MLASLLLFLNSTSESSIAWSIFYKSQTKKRFNIRCRPHYYGAGLKTEAEITNHLRKKSKKGQHS